MLSRRFALIALSLFAAALVAAAPASAQEAQDNSGERSITVAGDGVLFADNDIATFRLGVTTRRRAAGDALRANSQTMRRITAAIRALGVSAADLETDVVSLDRTTVRRRTFYVARNAVAVTIRDLDDAGAIVDAAVRAGATSVFGPDFGLANRDVIYRDALGLAFADARTKAERLAREAGLTLGPALRIRESGVQDFDDSEAGGNALAVGAPGSGEPPVSPGRTQVTASVVVTFAAGQAGR